MYNWLSQWYREIIIIIITIIMVDSLERYMVIAEEKLLKEALQNEIVENRKNRKTKDEVKNDYEERYKGKGLHGQFWKGIENVKGEWS